MPKIANFFKLFQRKELITEEQGLPNNSNSTEFERVVDDHLSKLINQNSVTNDGTMDNIAQNSIYSLSYGDYMLSTINTNKIDRIKQYTQMSRYPEIDWCIDEIADDFYHRDDNNKYISLSIPPEVVELNDKKKSILTDEFARLVSLLKLDEMGFQIIKKFIIEGEIAYENIIDPTQPTKGIIGFKFLDNRVYNFLRDDKTGNIVGICIDKLILNQLNLQRYYSIGHQSATVFNAVYNSPTYTYGAPIDENKIPLLWPQVTYFNSGIFNDDKTTVYPVIEKATAPYQQLTLLHDACVILRITRAPQKLVFNISTGGLPEKDAKRFVNQFMNNYKSKKSATGDGSLRNTYNPETMLESFFFWKSEGHEGSSVSSIDSTAKYNEMDDIELFLRRVIKSFKIPFSRFKEAQEVVQRKDTITYEEYSFCRFIIRLHKQFASALKTTYITNLKLRGIWQQYNLSEDMFDITFTPPSLFELYQIQTINGVKMEIFKGATESAKIPNSIALKKYLGFSDEQILQIRKATRDEAMYAAKTEYLVEQLKASGKIEDAGVDDETDNTPGPETTDTTSEEPLDNDLDNTLPPSEHVDNIIPDEPTEPKTPEVDKSDGSDESVDEPGLITPPKVSKFGKDFVKSVLIKINDK